MKFTNRRRSPTSQSQLAHHPAEGICTICLTRRTSLVTSGVSAHGEPPQGGNPKSERPVPRRASVQSKPDLFCRSAGLLTPADQFTSASMRAISAIKQRGSSTLAVFVVLLSSMASGYAIAQAPTIKINPDPIRFGQGCLYSIDNTPPGANSYLWEYKFVAPVTSTWIPVCANNTTATQSVFEALPGTCQVRCIIGLQGNQANPKSLFPKAPSCPKRGTGSEPARCLSPFSGRWRWKWGQAPAEDVRSQSPFPHAGTSGTDSNPAPITVLRTVVVPKPDSYTITGTGVSTALNTDCVITFHVTQGGIRLPTSKALLRRRSRINAPMST